MTAAKKKQSMTQDDYLIRFTTPPPATPSHPPPLPQALGASGAVLAASPSVGVNSFLSTVEDAAAADEPDAVNDFDGRSSSRERGKFWRHPPSFGAAPLPTTSPAP